MAGFAVAEVDLKYSRPEVAMKKLALIALPLALVLLLNACVKAHVPPGQLKKQLAPGHLKKR
jgi:hypothetical protein